MVRLDLTVFSLCLVAGLISVQGQPPYFTTNGPNYNNGRYPYQKDISECPPINTPGIASTGSSHIRYFKETNNCQVGYRCLDGKVIDIIDCRDFGLNMFSLAVRVCARENEREFNYHIWNCSDENTYYTPQLIDKRDYICSQLPNDTLYAADPDNCNAYFTCGARSEDEWFMFCPLKNLIFDPDAARNDPKSGGRCVYPSDTQRRCQRQQPIPNPNTRFPPPPFYY